MLNFTFTFWVNIYTMIGREKGAGEAAARCGVVAVSSSSHIQFKVAFADACLNNLQSTVGLPPTSFPLPLTPVVTNRSEWRTCPTSVEQESGREERSHSSTESESKSASAVGSSSLSFAQLISAIYKHVAGLPYTPLHNLPFPYPSLLISFCGHPFLWHANSVFTWRFLVAFFSFNLSLAANYLRLIDL